MYGRGNPFEKRATEYIAEGYDFVSVALPDPLETFFVPFAEENRLYDRLVLVIGSPGSGKTTIAKLLQYNHVVVANRDEGNADLRHTRDVLRRCDVLDANGTVNILGCRLPLEGEYRDFWNLPYSDDLKARLMFALMQSRAVLLWLRYLEQSGQRLDDISITPRDPDQAAVSAIGGVAGPGLKKRATAVERAIYGVVAALVPPPITALNLDDIGPYQPFDVIESIGIVGPNGLLKAAKPLVMMDDAHTLHPMQQGRLQVFLARREIRIGRWLLMRYDGLTAESVLEREGAFTGVSSDGSQAPFENPTRDITEVWLQGNDRRGQDRLAFRRLARGMASRYLQQMPIFRDRGQRDLSMLLRNEAPVASESVIKIVSDECSKAIVRDKIAKERADILESESRNLAVRKGVGLDVAYGVFRILLQRYADRVPQVSLLDGVDAEPNRPLAVEDPLVDAAAIQLMHQFDRPYYYGFDDIADASSENAEEFLRLAAELVSILETSAIRSRASIEPLTPARQHKLIREAATSRIARWNFPEIDMVSALIECIADACLKRTMIPSAPLNSGPNAIGFREEEFCAMPTRYPRFARILQQGVANNALSIKRRHPTKGNLWCLVTLNGVLCLKYGLTLKRGGFIDNIRLSTLAIRIGADVLR